jgi:hypothetical protein
MQQRDRMSARPLVVLLALASLVGCHRRTFEHRAAQSDVIVTSTTVITNADVPVTTPAPAPAATATGTAAPAAPPTTLSNPLPPAPSEADRTATNLGLRDAGESTTASSAPTSAPNATSTPTFTAEPAPAEEPYRAPSAADRIPWAGDSNTTPGAR